MIKFHEVTTRNYKYSQTEVQAMLLQSIYKIKYGLYYYNFTQEYKNLKIQLQFW